MNHADILTHLAPCGLSCATCFAFAGGQIGAHSRALRQLLGNFDVYAERFSAFLPAFGDYPAFKRLLSFLAAPDCTGCRTGACKYPKAAGESRSWPRQRVGSGMQHRRCPPGRPVLSGTETQSDGTATDALEDFYAPARTLLPSGSRPGAASPDRSQVLAGMTGDAEASCGNGGRVTSTGGLPTAQSANAAAKEIVR